MNNGIIMCDSENKSHVYHVVKVKKDKKIMW